MKFKCWPAWKITTLLVRSFGWQITPPLHISVIHKCWARERAVAASETAWRRVLKGVPHRLDDRDDDDDKMPKDKTKNMVGEHNQLTLWRNFVTITTVHKIKSCSVYAEKLWIQYQWFFSILYNNLGCKVIVFSFAVSKRLADAGVQLVDVFPLVHVGRGGIVLRVSENAVLVDDPSALPRDLGIPGW